MTLILVQDVWHGGQKCSDKAISKQLKSLLQFENQLQSTWTSITLCEYKHKGNIAEMLARSHLKKGQIFFFLGEPYVAT